ncbi:peptide deformylase [Neorickettsia risticii]
MALLKLVIEPDPILHEVSGNVVGVSDEKREFLDDMLETMYHYGGIGLAAVQVGVLERIIVVDVPPDKEWHSSPLNHVGYESSGGPYYLVNPEIIEFSRNLVSADEGCLSLPEQNYEIVRPDAVVVKYLNYNGEECLLKANGWLARCIQHEVDHLDGKLYVSHLSKLKYDLATKKAAKIKKRHSEV